jgi:hypothetical protein
MAAKLTGLTHKIAIKPHLMAESCTICSSRSRRPVRKLLDTPSYVCLCVCVCVCVNIYFFFTKLSWIDFSLYNDFLSAAFFIQRPMVLWLWMVRWKGCGATGRGLFGMLYENLTREADRTYDIPQSVYWSFRRKSETRIYRIWGRCQYSIMWWAQLFIYFSW